MALQVKHLQPFKTPNICLKAAQRAATMAHSWNGPWERQRSLNTPATCTWVHAHMVNMLNTAAGSTKGKADYLRPGICQIHSFSSIDHTYHICLPTQPNINGGVLREVVEVGVEVGVEMGVGMCRRIVRGRTCTCTQRGQGNRVGGTRGKAVPRV